MLYFDYQEPYPNFYHSPQRIVSMCPSLTETIFALGAGERLVGRTKFCIRPHGRELEAVPKIGGTKNPDLNAIRELWPDCVFVVKEENMPHHVEKIASFTDVVVYNVKDVKTALNMIRSLQTILRVESPLDKVVAENWETARGIMSAKAACLVWKNPYMVAGGDTYIHSVMTHLGLENVFAERSRYPSVGEDELGAVELLLLPTEPYPFRDIHVRELDEKYPNVRKALVDGQMMTWYGARMVSAAGYFKIWARDLNRTH